MSSCVDFVDTAQTRDLQAPALVLLLLILDWKHKSCSIIMVIEGTNSLSPNTTDLSLSGSASQTPSLISTKTDSIVVCPTISFVALFWSMSLIPSWPSFVVAAVVVVVVE